MIVKIQEDIFQYEHRVLGNFTARQLVFCGITLATVAPVFIGLFWTTGDPNISVIAAALVGLPILCCAIFKKDGVYLEKIIYIRFLEKFRYRQQRKFVMTNLYEVLQENQKEYETYAVELKKQAAKEGKQSHRPRFLSLVQKRQRTK